jgi:hypothetical protein
MFKLKYISFITLCLGMMSLTAQERQEDTLKTDVINVIKPYTPTISDAFKLKEQPNLNDDAVNEKKQIDYSIFSFPVASTFTPAKGKAAVIDKAKKELLYDNYAHLGLGTNTTILGEVYLNHSIGRNQNIGAYLSHLSSQVGVDDVLKDTNFSESKIDLNYNNRSKDYSFQLNTGFEFKNNNWYGLQQPLFTQDTADSLDVSQSYNNAYIKGNVNFENSILKSGDVLFRRFGDKVDSAENRFLAETESEFELLESPITLGLYVDYLSGSFERNYFTEDVINYGNIQVGLLPTYTYTTDDLFVNIGLKTVYANDTEFGKSKFFIYPNVKATYNLVDQYVSAFAGLTGELKQNSYYAFAEDNSFVSPDLFITPSDQQYKAFGGLRGKITNSTSYQVNASYSNTEAHALYKNNTVTGTNRSYTYGNSFGVVYDNIATLQFGGRIDLDINEKVNLGVKGDFYAYTTTFEEEAWNLPTLEVTSFLDYKINDKFTAGASLFFVGERKDELTLDSVSFPNVEPTVVTLDAYIDLNAQLSYLINNQFSAYFKALNLVSGQYEKWQNTPVQGFQIMVGATYKFNF